MPPGDQKMPELVHEDEHAENEDECQNRNHTGILN
jgi:hypothetical protein